MTKNAKNNKDKTITDMILYFNILLSSEEKITESIKYDWIDAFSFTGGFIDLLILFVIVFFSFYNYRLNDAKMMQQYELEKAKFDEENKHTEISKLITDNEHWISQILFY